MKKGVLFLIFFCYSTLIWSQNPVPFYPTIGASGVFFGGVVDIDGTEIISASQSDAISTTNVGKVYLFGLNGSSIEQKQVFYPNDATSTDAFGYSISIQNNFIAVGSPGHDFGASNAGAVYLYQKGNTDYQFLQKITAYDGETNDYFGNNVKLYNNDLFVAANGEEANGVDTSFGNGAVYVYHFNGISWVFSEKLSVPNTNALGRKIDIENNTLVISSDDFDNPILHTFYWDGTHWAFHNSSGAMVNDNYISDFSLANNQLYALVFNASQDETVAVFNNVNGNWVNSETISPVSDDLVLTGIEVDGDALFLGSNNPISASLIRFPVLQYHKNGIAWEAQPSLFGTTDSTVQPDFFGFSIASKGNKVVIGAPFETEAPIFGKAYYLDTTLGTGHFETKNSHLYPNPAHDLIRINNTTTAKIIKLEVFSVTGNLLLTSTNCSNQISLEKFSEGLYFVKIYYQNAVEETFKVIKN